MEIFGSFGSSSARLKFVFRKRLDSLAEITHFCVLCSIVQSPGMNGYVWQQFYLCPNCYRKLKIFSRRS